MERFFDILFSGFALFALAPVLLPVMAILKVTGEGEVFFLQERIGKSGRKFKLFKFATMLKDSPNIGTGTVTVKDDPRVLPIGGILRKSKINELPQLLNILFGDMSVIGPRPLTTETFRAYPSRTQSAIQSVKPGLSGIGSIVFRDEENILHGNTASIEYYNEVIAPYKGHLEEWFVKNKGIDVYFLAIAVTLWTVLMPSPQLAWRVFRGLPTPPPELKRALGYPS
ncbi:glycosyl transferase possibly involved in lipopolysaccharide synthesis [gamma proteobacterium HIMB55]|nr:glycosyl transferase possibly involved in lipopolysaccharide synthesis [gamma proteobacterium HIMB55]